MPSFVFLLMAVNCYASFSERSAIDAFVPHIIQEVNFCHIGNIKTLIHSGHDINTSPIGGATPLHVASRRGCFDAVNVLLAFGANPMALDILGRTPLDNALAFGYEDIAEILKANVAFRLADSERPWLGNAYDRPWLSQAMDNSESTIGPKRVSNVVSANVEGKNNDIAPQKNESEELPRIRIYTEKVEEFNVNE